ncbi:MAG TPA: sialate O-acetylesterase [Blastocatellia bacterium]|nr:sialate O-acetylesterase [Blastocatellia bacterium]
MKRFLRSFLVSFGALLTVTANVATAVYADIKLPSIISEGMVLQQGINVPLWGWADEGESVAIEFQGQKFTTMAKGGKWMVRLKPLKAGGPFTLSLSGKNRIEFKNVLVGEVWICGGQSNMGWRLNQSDNADAEIASAKYPMIRLFSVPRAEVDTPVIDVKAEWKECSPETAATFSAVGYYFGRDLHKARNVPIGLINNAVGGSPAESWMSAVVLDADTEYKQFNPDYQKRMELYEKAMEKQREDAEKAKAENKPAPRAPGKPWMPSGLYNGMLAPLAPYGIRGAIWYQGESNAGRAYQYRRLFPTMITNWRALWGQGDFPFLFVQLAAFGPNSPKLGESDWAELREAQLMTLSALPKTGMSLAIDVGTYDDIHPRNKQPVGSRLALSARAIAYGEKIVHSGPVYQSMKVEGGKVSLNFNHIGGGLEARGGELKGFIIAGDDKVWREAKAEIKGDHVIVSSAEVTNPVAVRYAWMKFPTCNLYNKEGLPATPFRTDDWPGVTQTKVAP